MRKDFRGPAAKHFDWPHILERHSDNGIVALQSRKKTTFVGLSEAQIKTRVRAAWRYRNRIRSQTDDFGVERVVYVEQMPPAAK